MPADRPPPHALVRWRVAETALLIVSMGVSTLAFPAFCVVAQNGRVVPNRSLTGRHFLPAVVQFSTDCSAEKATDVLPSSSRSPLAVCCTPVAVASTVNGSAVAWPFAPAASTATW
jgi:hypothetical protein